MTLAHQLLAGTIILTLCISVKFGNADRKMNFLGLEGDRPDIAREKKKVMIVVLNSIRIFIYIDFLNLQNGNHIQKVIKYQNGMCRQDSNIILYCFFELA